METKTVKTSDLPLRIEGAYILLAYRYGHRDGHSYLVDVCGGIDTASERAEEEANERGGKYSVVVFAKNRMTEEIEEIYEAKCPEQYTNSTTPLISARQHQYDMVDFGKWMALKYGDINGCEISVLLNEYLEENNQHYMPPDNGDSCWQVGSETFSRKEVADMLHTQRAMLTNDLKIHCGNELTEKMFHLLKNPRKPQF